MHDLSVPWLNIMIPFCVYHGVRRWPEGINSITCRSTNLENLKDRGTQSFHWAAFVLFD